MKLVLTLLGRDDRNRPVYEGNDNKLYVDIEPHACYPHIHTKSGNHFDGEPDMPIDAEITFVPCRDTW